MEVKAGYKQTEVGVIPEEWEVGCVGDSFDLCNQLRLPISQSVRERIAGPYPYYGPTSVQGWINEYRVEGEYALIGEDGDHFLKWRSQPMTLLVRGKFNVNNHAHLVRGTKNLTEWFYWFFANRDITPHLTRQGAGRYKLTKAALLQIPCALPSQPEQRAIAGALGDVDALLDAMEKLIAKKHDLKQAAMQQLLTGQTRLPGFTGDWMEKRLGDVIEEIGDGATPSTANPHNFGGSIHWVVIDDIRDDIMTTKTTLTECGLQSCAATLWKPGTLILSTGATIGEVGIARIPVATKQGICGIVVDQGEANTIFLKYWFVHNKSLLLSKAQGSSIKEVRAPTLVQFEIGLPKIPEQTAIVAVLSDMDAEIAAVEQRLVKTRTLKQGMMQELLTGKTRLI